MSATASIHESWKGFLDAEFASDYMTELRAYLKERKAQSAVVFPHSSVWFNAFSLTPLDAVKVVILGQDPYHGPGPVSYTHLTLPTIPLV